MCSQPSLQTDGAVISHKHLQFGHMHLPPTHWQLHTSYPLATLLNTLLNFRTLFGSCIVFSKTMAGPVGGSGECKVHLLVLPSEDHQQSSHRLFHTKCNSITKSCQFSHSTVYRRLGCSVPAARYTCIGFNKLLNLSN